MVQRLEAVRPNRIPPHNLDAEQSVLGAMLESKDAIANTIEILESEHFYKPAHVEIYETILALYARGEAVDAITVADELARRGKLDAIGGKPYIHGLLEAYPTASSAAYYAHIVEELSLLRNLIDAGNKVQEIGFSMPEDVAEAVNDAEELVFNVGDKRLKDDYHEIRKLLMKSMTDIEARYDSGANLTGISSGFADLDDKTSGFQPSNLIIVAARPSMGKCLAGSSTVVDPDSGARISIADFVKQQTSRIFNLDRNARVQATEASDWIPNGLKECFRLTTRSGRTIDATDNHPFLTVDGWVPLGEIRVGRKIAIPRRLPVFGTNESWSPERVRLLAYFIAEGGLTGRSARFTNADPVIVDDFKAAVEKEFDNCVVTGAGITYCSRSDRLTRPRRLSPVTSWLTELGLMGKKADAKYFPDEVWTFTKRLLSEFLRALFSCDGTIYGMSGYPRIEFAVASERLAQDVHHALLRFGIVSKLWRKTERCWRVEITDPASTEIYQNEIGWIGEKSNRRFEMLRNRRTRSNTGHLPQEVWTHVKKALAEKKMSLSELARQAGEKGWTNIHTNRGLPQRHLARYAEILDDADLRWLASEHLYWDEVVSIESVGEHEVYDLTVPDGSNFVAQDIFVHNSSLLNDFALHVASKQKLPVLIFTLEMSRDEVVKRFLSSEAKVDAQKLNKGALLEQDWTRLSAALGRLAEAPIFIDDSANINLMEIRAKCRRLKAKHGLGMVVIDYLQLMQSPRKSENRQQEVSEISRNLKILARELQVPVLCASQLNRGVEMRADKRPLLGDLRESGCLTGETLVTLASGERRPIAELVGQQPDVKTLDGWHIADRKATKVWRVGTKPVFRLTTASGRSVRATEAHPFLKLDGWMPLGELQAGDRIAVPRHLATTEIGNRLDADRLVLLAHLIGDGCFASRQPLHYTSESEENFKAVEEAALRAFGVVGRRVEQDSWTHVYLSAGANKWHPNPITTWLRELGLGGLRSHEKFVPEAVFSLPPSQIALFLRHLWATDGCVWLRSEGSKGQRVSVYYASNSLRLAMDVQELLVRLGIQSRIKKTQKAAFKPGYQVIITGKSDQLRFTELVGGHGHKAAVVEEASKILSSIQANTNKDTIPVEVWSRVKDRMRERGVSQRRMAEMRGTTYGGTSHFRFAPSRETLAGYGELLEDGELKEIASSDVFWDTVVSVEPDGVEDVYDMTVPGTHNFVADGIVCKNSIEQDADLVMFIYRDEVYNPDTEARGEAELILAKHRNGPTGTIRLAFMNQYTKFASIARNPM